MDDNRRKSIDGSRDSDSGSGSNPANRSGVQAEQTEASWFKKKDWFTFGEACGLMECDPRTLHCWIREGLVLASFPPGTDGNGEWFIHADSVANKPSR